MSDVVKPPIHGRDHRAGGSDPIPGLSSSIPPDYLQGSASPSLGTSLTAVSFTDISGFNSGSYMSISSGDIHILASGVYRFDWYTSGWVLAALVTSLEVGAVNVTSGSIGNWAGRLGSDEASWEIPLRINDSGDTIDVSPAYNPSSTAVAAWGSGATFPVVIQTKMYKTEDGSGAADTPSVRMSVVRIGDVFE